MEITILGSGTSIPSIKRSSPSTLVNIDNNHILLDTGPGSLRQLKKSNISLNQVDTITTNMKVLPGIVYSDAFTYRPSHNFKGLRRLLLEEAVQAVAST